jgi:hypothetical protein
VTPSRQGRAPQAIVEGLAGARRALAAGDLDAAADLLAAVEAACAAADASGARLSAGELAEASTLQGQLETMARHNQASLMASLLHSARARTANHAYKPDP